MALADILEKTTSQMPHLNKPNICLHCGGSLFYDQEDKEWRCYNCARPDNSNNHNGETESLQSTTVKECLHPSTRLNSDTDKPGKIANPSSSCPSPPVKPRERLRVVPDKEWYPPNEITFHRNHILFIIKHLESLREGIYPQNPCHSGYTDTSMPMPKKQKRARHHAYFETPVTLAAEVERRLEHCSLDGILPQLLYTYSWPEEIIAKYYRISVEEVKFRAEAILWRISGWEYKAGPYRRWHVYRDYGNQREKQSAKQS